MLRCYTQCTALSRAAVGCVRFTSTDTFLNRHIGPTKKDTADMLKTVGIESLADLMTSVIPADTRRPPLSSFSSLRETEVLTLMKSIGSQNRILKSMIGQGYYECITPPPILRNVLENPMWYTPYTPYQAEISQGRLEALLTFQTMVSDLTRMDLANASLLDQATAAAEAMVIAFQHHRQKRKTFFVANTVFATSISLIKTRAAPLGIHVKVGSPADVDLANPQLAGVFVQTPDALGDLHDFTSFFHRAHENDVVCCCGTDLLASCLIKPVGEMGADVVVGSSQRFGAPLGYGGPHAAFIAVSEKLKRLCPGRIVGISRDSAGDPAMRLVLQTREQHVKRERATSNICTSQTLYANVSAFYAMYHGPTGLKQLAAEIHTKAKVLAVGLASLGYRITNERYFDTITFSMMDRDITAEMYYLQCAKKGVNVFMDALSQSISISVDEVTTEHHIACVLEAAGMSSPNIHALSRVASSMSVISSELVRTSDYLQGLAFKSYKSETELMRYIQHLQRKDFSLVHGMMPLGSCTMKLNPAAALRAFLWPEFSALHPFAPDDQARGYSSMIVDFKQKMCDITGMAACSIQPNSGAQGEYAGLRIIQAYHKSRGESHRNICLIPESAHGTNPASATLAGLKVVPVKCLDSGKIDMDDMRIKCTDYATELSCFMITYPSTHGIYDDDIIKMTHMVHANGGQCYMDGANLNAIIGYTGPGFIGVDACQLNLHKTFAVPHGGGGPGVGPIVVRQHLASFLPNSVMGPAVGGSRGYGTLSQCGYGSASLVTISYALLLLLGSRGLKTCTEYAVLNANYLKKRLEGHYPICFLGEKDYCAHEFIIDVRPLKQSARVSAQDIAKRLMDYGFHAPTVSFPITDTLMIEPTESESKRELDRFADAMISIRGEIAAIERGDAAPQNNVIKNAPHTAKMVTSDEWTYPYTRRLAAYPSRHQVADKFWPSVGRIEEVYGDRQMMCTCGPLEFYN